MFENITDAEFAELFSTCAAAHSAADETEEQTCFATRIEPTCGGFLVRVLDESGDFVGYVGPSFN